jgi:aarF domain-containing kinase
MWRAARRGAAACALAASARAAWAVAPLFDEPARTAEAVTSKFPPAAAGAADAPLAWRWRLALTTFDRLVRDVATAARVASIYAARARAGGAWPPAHAAAADALLALAQANGGVYVKAAQHLAQLSHLLPPEVTRALAVMTHAAPRDSFALAARVFEEETGLPLEGAGSPFAAVARAPVASASLAQVHAATLRGSGARVAVKIQHAGLRESAAADIATVRLLTRAAAWAFPDFDLGWLADEMAANLPLELDFCAERANMERAGSLWAAERGVRVAVPRAVPALCARRVLVMTFEEGCFADDARAMAAARLAPAAVADLVARAFARAVFGHALAHCDPHASNVLVRAGAPRGWAARAWAALGGAPEPELVLLDHGLYRALPPALLNAYADMWASVLAGDEPGIARAAERLGVRPPLHALLAAMLAAQSFDRILAVGARGDVRAVHSTRGAAAAREETAAHAATYAGGIATILRQLDRRALLLLKLNDVVRALGAGLGAPPHFAFAALAREAQRARARAARAARPGARTEAAAALERLALEARLAGVGGWVAWAGRGARAGGARDGALALA